jgi:beta-lactamase class A
VSVDAGDIGGLFASAGCRGSLCALDVDGPGEVAIDGDAAVVAASVFKVLVAVEYFRQAADGGLDPGERVRLDPADRTPGPTGFSTFADDVEASLRDLVQMMLVVSDNAATDAVLDRIGLTAVNASAVALGLTRTVVEADLRTLVDSIGQDAGFAGWAELQAATGPDADPASVLDVRARLLTVRALVPSQTTRTTARDMAALLRLVWRDEAGPADGCANLRRMMAGQVSRNRLAPAFSDGVRVAAKSGSLLGVARNEIGVVEYPDGGRYAVAVFTHAYEPFRGENEINRAIGAAAATAIARLRTRWPAGLSGR